jgi:hypothetical protein
MSDNNNEKWEVSHDGEVWLPLIPGTDEQLKELFGDAYQEKPVGLHKVSVTEFYEHVGKFEVSPSSVDKRRIALHDAKSSNYFDSIVGEIHDYAVRYDEDGTQIIYNDDNTTFYIRK